MALQGYQHKSPVITRSNKGKWPNINIDDPVQQFFLLKEKYIDKEPGRIPLPKNQQQLWSQHKFSVLARNQSLYKKISRDVSNNETDLVQQLSLLVTEILRDPPTEEGIRNAKKSNR